MSTHPHDDDAASELSPVDSRPVPTPRGGFMARPGLKMPPRHAVVVRGGNTRTSERIPVARSSCPPPAPAAAQRPSDPAPAPGASCDKATLPAIPRVPVFELAPQTPRVVTGLPAPPESAPAPRSVGSVPPPPSDAPVATSVREPTPLPPPVKRRSWWAVVAAAAIGLLLGLGSIAATLGRSRTAAHEPAAEPLATGAHVSSAPASSPAADEAELAANAGAPPPSAAVTPAQPPASAPAMVRKKSIF